MNINSRNGRPSSPEQHLLVGGSGLHQRELAYCSGFHHQEPGTPLVSSPPSSACCPLNHRTMDSSQETKYGNSRRLSTSTAPAVVLTASSSSNYRLSCPHEGVAKKDNNNFGFQQQEMLPLLRRDPQPLEILPRPTITTTTNIITTSRTASVCSITHQHQEVVNQEPHVLFSLFFHSGAAGRRRSSSLTSRRRQRLRLSHRKEVNRIGCSSVMVDTTPLSIINMKGNALLPMVSCF